MQENRIRLPAMATAPRIRLNFLPLATQVIGGTLWRKLLPPTMAKPEHALCYTLPTDHDPEQRATYLISLTAQADYTEWEFLADQNRQLALRYLFELLITTTRDQCGADTYTIHYGFQRAVAYSLTRTPLGEQEIWLEPYYLAATKQYGFLVDFHFNKPEQVPYSRDVQRLSLSLDEHYRSNKSAYIDVSAERDPLVGGKALGGGSTSGPDETDCANSCQPASDHGEGSRFRDLGII